MLMSEPVGTAVTPAAQPPGSPWLNLVRAQIVVSHVIGLGERLRKGKLRVHTVVRTDGKLPLDEGRTVEQVIRHIDHIDKLERDVRSTKEALAAKKMSQKKRDEFKQSIAGVELQMAGHLEAVHLNKERVSIIVLKVKALIARVDEAERELAECERRVDVPVEELEDLDRVVRTAIRKIMRVQEEAMLPVEELRRLYAPIEEWRRLAVEKPIFRLQPAPPALRRLDLRVIEARIVELATQTVISTALPRVRLRTELQVTSRRRSVAFVPGRPAVAGAPLEPSDGLATYADLGRVGESLVFAMMLARWTAAAGVDTGRVRGLLRSIAAEYWSLDHAAKDELESALAGAPDGWFDTKKVRDLLWPSQTFYGDAMGFDLFGLNDAGDDWLCIEVKTTQGPAATQFELSVNEYGRANTEGARYVIARVARIHADLPEVRFWCDPAAMVERGDLRLVPASF